MLELVIDIFVFVSIMIVGVFLLRFFIKAWDDFQDKKEKEEKMLKKENGNKY